MNTNNLLQESVAVPMIVLPQSALDEFRAGIAELKQMLNEKNLQELQGQWIESEEARKLLGVSSKTWQTYRDNRVIPFSQFGRKIYVKRAHIEAFLENHMIRA